MPQKAKSYLSIIAAYFYTREGDHQQNFLGLFYNLKTIHKRQKLVLSHTIQLLKTLKKKAWKTLWEKEKMLVTSIFSFFHSVFHSIIEQNHHFGNVCHLQMLSICSRPRFCHLVKRRN